MPVATCIHNIIAMYVYVCAHIYVYVAIPIYYIVGKILPVPVAVGSDDTMHD